MIDFILREELAKCVERAQIEKKGGDETRKLRLLRKVPLVDYLLDELDRAGIKLSR